MRNKTRLTVFVLFCTYLSGNCQKRCEITGAWILKGTQTPQGETYNYDRAVFSKDSIHLASGFYYPIINQNDFDEWKTGRHPFVYYSNKERYKIVGDSLYLYNAPFKEWESFGITCNESGDLRLVGDRGEWILKRKELKTLPLKRHVIRYIRAHVREVEDVGSYALNYRVTYSRDNKFVYEQMSGADPDHAVKTFQLKSGSFDEICRGFDYLDITQIQKRYETSFSDPEVIELELGLEDGRVIKSRVAGPEYPEELKLALIPVLYGYQRIMFSHLKPVYQVPSN